MIHAEKLTFGFNSTLLFQDISFTLEENCHCALIGSNGTGKTTLMNLIREPRNYIYDGKLHLERAQLAAFAHGEYYELGRRIGTFGFSVKKKKKHPPKGTQKK